VSYYYDQVWYENIRDFGNNIGLNEYSQMQKAFCFHPKACIQVPSDTATSLYYLGDGITYLTLASSFLTYGKIYKDKRAISTGSQMIEGLIDIAVTTQVLKRVFGRQTPMKATQDRGTFTPFVNLNTYQSNIPSYDSFPSGHVAAVTSSFVIMNENYPEYSTLIKTSYALVMSVLSLEMIHLGVHYTSDYPLGIIIGYYFGKVVSARHSPYQPVNIRGMQKRITSIFPIIEKDRYSINFNIIL
jgi:membrane-associated phospholipid phosphatase